MQAALGIANLCVRAMQTEGTSISEARNKIWMMDIDGLLAKGRPEGRLEGIFLVHLSSILNTVVLYKIN